MCSYTSSDNSQIPVSRSNPAMAAISSAVNIAPDGLCGLLIISIRVFGVIAARTCSQSGAKVCGSSATCTARAPARSIAGS